MTAHTPLRSIDALIAKGLADPAGRAATMKVIRLFVEAELPCKIAQLRAIDGRKVDPDDLARNDLPRLQKMIDSATPAVEFFFDQVASSSEPSVEGKVKAIEECLPILRGVREALARDLYIDRLARLLAVDPNLVRRSLRAAGPAEAQRRPQQAQAAAPQEKAPEQPKPRAIPAICYKLLALLAQKPELMSKLTDEHLGRLPDPAVRALLEGARSQGAFVARVVLESAGADIRDAVAKAMLSEEFAGEIEGEAVLRAITTELTLPTDRRALEDARADAIKRGERWLVEIITKRIVSGTRIQGETPR